MTAVKLGAFRQVLCAAPSWIESHGRISHPSEIPERLALTYRFPGSASGYPWAFEKGDKVIELLPTSPVMFDDLDTYISAGCYGLGPICALSFQVQRHIERGDLVPMLANWSGMAIDTHALTPEKRLRSRRVQLTLDWIKQNVRGD